MEDAGGESLDEPNIDNGLQSLTKICGRTAYNIQEYEDERLRVRYCMYEASPSNPAARLQYTLRTQERQGSGSERRARSQSSGNLEV